MSLQDLSLPIDIPWKLIATSRDMLASAQNPFPNSMWKSSLAVFAYDPDLSDLPEAFSDRELSFLKVVASITSYTPPQPDPIQFGENFAGFQAAEAAAETSFPCSGALVQVAIYPKTAAAPTAKRPIQTEKPPMASGPDVSTLAYFTAMEPQKRELIEAVTESGESMTQSKSDVDVRKGITTTNTTEELNLFTGLNISGGGGGKSGAFGQGSVGISGQWGTIKKGTTEVVNQVNSDTSREKREGSSHTTNLSQLYHLLNGYHLGTNRAIFFLQSRPHTVQQKDRFTFINGPEEIEGIQEFFLVVSRPKGKALTDYCVDALLYTAHLEPDTLSTALLEPKTAETQWIDLWATARVLPQSNDSHLEIGTIPPMPISGVSDPINYNNIVPQDVTTFSNTQSDFSNRLQVPTGDTFSLVVNRDKNSDDGHGGRNPNLPAILDQTITTGVLRPTGSLDARPEPGWRVDRTRGLGGYDLWEDPKNNTNGPDGDPDSSTKPQSFIDIISSGTTADPTRYYPDCAVRLRAMTWPAGSKTTALYHARLKVFFIRDETPDSGRTVPMLVTARGISTCANSAAANLYADSSDPSGLPADIAAEAAVSPANVPPWTTPSTPTTSVATETPPAQSGSNQGQAPASQPNPLKGSAIPSGMDPSAIGAARAKMANSLIPAVRRALQTLLSAPPAKPTSFQGTDLFFKVVSAKVIEAEMNQLARAADKQPQLAHAIALHPLAAQIPGGGAVSQAASALTGGRKATAATIHASAEFPALTLGATTLTKAEHASLMKAGIHSGLDLLALTGKQLAAKLGIDDATARALRLKVIGLAPAASSQG